RLPSGTAAGSRSHSGWRGRSSPRSRRSPRRQSRSAREKACGPCDSPVSSWRGERQNKTLARPFHIGLATTLSIGLAMLIDHRHPDRNQPLLAHAARALEAMGAQVRIAAGGENLVRRSEPRDDTAAPFVVEAEGLKNLLHELVHVVLLGRLAPDHATD